MVRLDGYGPRKPVQLSGGQRQRVALARSIVNQPKVLLLDEPLGALDLKLRQEMQVFLKALQQELGMTFLYVTHDQEEALTMSDHLAVFNEGRIEQIGSPAERLRAARERVRRRVRRHVEHPRARRPAVHRAAGEGRACSRAATARASPAGSATSSISAPSRATSSSSTAAASWSRCSRTSRRRPPRRSSSAGSRVRLTWRPEHTFEIETPGADPPARRTHNVRRIRKIHLLARRARRGTARARSRRVARRRQRPADDDRQGRRLAQPDRVVCVQRPELREEVRAADRLHDPPQGRRQLERDGRADADGRRWRRRPVRPRVGLRRREPAADLRRRRPAGRTST